MKKVVLLLVFSFLSCQKTFDKTEIMKLNGYWQILNVTFPDGEEKFYNDNPSVDFIKINDSLVGFRMKLVPMPTGKFATNDIKEVFSVENNTLHYKTDFAEWKEEIVSIQDTLFSVKNEEGKEYTYVKKQVE